MGSISRSFFLKNGTIWHLETIVLIMSSASLVINIINILPTGSSIVFNSRFAGSAGNETLLKEKKFMELEHLSAIIFPCYKGDSIFKLMEFTSMVEGDLLRLFRQMLDRMGQVKNATDDENLCGFIGGCQERILQCIKEVDGI